MLPPLYDKDGSLRLEAFNPAAQRVVKGITKWLNSIGRGIYLPLDLMIVLLGIGHDELGHAIAGGTVGTVAAGNVLERLRELGREIEDRHSATASLERASFSRSFARILDESWEQANGRAGSTVTEEDLLRAVMWRAEATESASVRWAIKRLAEGGGDKLFDSKSQLKRDGFDQVSWGFLHAAMQLAARSGTPFLGTPHLIASLCSVKESVLWRAALARDLDPSRLREELLRIIGVKPGPLPDFLLGRKTLTPRMVRMLAYARGRAEKRDDDGLIGETELVEAFLNDGGSSLELVQALGLEAEVVKALGEPRVLQGALNVEHAVSAGSMWEPSRPTPTLDLIGRDLTQQVREGKLPRIIGRDRELQRVINVLLRQEQRNPLLTGEAGVGKTALAVALAQRIAADKVPVPLRGQRVVEINGASLMSGTSYRGELESRIKSLLTEASKGVILFIDEAHAVFAPRTGTHGPAEIPNHFKSALASGEIAVVGATTEAEYRRWMELDPALKRRFERIEIGEPGTDLTRRILEGLTKDLQEAYEVVVTADALDAALDYSVRYLPEQRLPDKAKKLLMDASIAAAHPIDDYERQPDAIGPVSVERINVAEQVSHRTGIPVDRLVRGKEGWWSGIAERLQKQIIGQSAAINQTARALVSGRLRPSATSRPLAVLVFFGPSGVGKGTLARTLALEIFGDERALLRLDMTDFSEPHAISRLIGSPPGYIGYDDEDMFVTPLRRRPSSVVLLEDIDKAHPKVVERLLRVFDEGEIADTRGMTADSRQAVFILTVTVETPLKTLTGRIGFSGSQEGETVTDPELFKAAFGELHSLLRGHVDTFIQFHAFGHGGEVKHIDALVARHLRDLATRMLEEYELSLVWQTEIPALIRDASQAEETHSLSEVFQREVVVPLTEVLLSESTVPGSTIRISTTEDGKFAFDSE